MAVAEPDWPGASVAAVAGGTHAPSLFALPALSRQGRPAFDPQAYDDTVPGDTPPVSLPSA
ncbi:hypothetical protein [Streptomyces stelliscabiei]|uniref:Uncharacterized protein n=1 Tax=Streptomyces stelliscabiei TaxID=146820 RepID=A0A8I0P2U1_9ACTN|nr:hypothetical protein [Streptomyces stelliscabiei]KND46340.1 hypothetical protein IQ64_01850 [Streptomyces stelliscabiei]MBE1595229.1 hypothetical protein [Streptomyces stelliscabiei]MDX2516185.1 hypothetical protein [Streptomyces stelliscabiei]MDX2553156.1 hypothetical protein [Streptomyces stelliscabiei]MDX2612144.1 hypothetical protein [Streptomyces stelliscabiei]